MTFDQFTAPIGEQRFLAEYHDRAPIHLPGDGGRLRFAWTRMNDLFAIAPHWTAGNLNLIFNSRPVDPAFYLDDVATADGLVRRADPAKIDLFLGLGASLVANAVDQIAPEIADVTAILAERFTALASANIYCSFDNIQAFATHCDSHEVYALQCEGQKRWRVYANRADTPLGHGNETQEEIDAARGPVALDVLMRPGDLLYIPRGQYHDAIAEQGASLHVTFSVAPRPGLAIVPLLETAMQRDPAFRAYLPAPAEAGGQALVTRLDELAGRLAALIRQPGFAIEVADLQRRVATPRHRVGLPERPASEHYARTARAAQLTRQPGGVVLSVKGRSQALGPAYAAAEWALGRPAFSARELAARFAHVPAVARGQLIEVLLREGLVQRYDPAV